MCFPPEWPAGLRVHCPTGGFSPEDSRDCREYQSANSFYCTVSHAIPTWSLPRLIMPLPTQHFLVLRSQSLTLGIFSPCKQSNQGFQSRRVKLKLYGWYGVLRGNREDGGSPLPTPWQQTVLDRSKSSWLDKASELPLESGSVLFEWQKIISNPGMNKIRMTGT